MKLVKDSNKNFLAPVALGLFIGLVGSIAVGKILGGEDGPTNKEFGIVLGTCLLLGGGLTPLLMRWLRKRRIEKQQRVLPTTGVVTSTVGTTTGSTSLSSGVTQKSGVVTTTDTVSTQQSFDIICKPQPYKPPMIERAPGEDPWASDALVTVLEDIYCKKRPDEIVPRIIKDIVSRAPAKSDSRFKLSAIRSEGPVLEDGSCTAGWTFFFVREDERLGCIATVTGRELSLQFGSTTDVEIPFSLGDVDSTADLGKDEVPDISAALAAVYAGVPEANHLPLYVRATLPDSVFVYTRDPLVIADVGIVGAKYILRNAEGFQEQLQANEERRQGMEHWSVEELLTWYRTREVLSPHLQVVMDREGSELARLSGDKILLRRIGRGLHTAHGPMTVRILEEAIQAALREDDVEEAKFLIRCMAFVPNATAIARLHTLSNTLDERVRGVATKLFSARRERSLGVRFDPVEELNFKELRAAMGRPQLVTIALRSRSYDIRESLLKALGELRLQTKRVRVITSRRVPKKEDAGQINITLRKGLITAAYLRAAEGGDCEGLLCVVPTPVPAYVLHLAGSAAEVFVQRIRRQGLEYTREMLIEDLQQRERQQLPALHRAVTYLKIWDPENPPPEVAKSLIDAYRSYPRAWQLRQSIIEALEYAPRAEHVEGDYEAELREEQIVEEVDDFLEGELDHLRNPVTTMEKRTHTLLTEILARRKGEGSSVVQSVISMTASLELLTADEIEEEENEPELPEVDPELAAVAQEPSTPPESK